MPGLILQRPLLIEEANARVSVRDLDVYSTGFMARLEATIGNMPAVPWTNRSGDLSYQLHELYSGQLDRLEVTVEMDTMSRSSISHAAFWPRDPGRTPPTQPVPVLLTSQGGGSTRFIVHCTAVWIPHLPLAGSVRFHAHWPRVAEKSSMVEIPASEFTSAAGDAVQLW